MALIYVARVHTGGSSVAEWRAARKPVMQREIGRWLGGWWEAAGIITLLLMAHTHLETGGGVGEDNFNLGNRRQFASRTGEAFERSGLPWASFPTLLDGVRGYLETILGNAARREATLQYLTHLDPRRWYREAILDTDYTNEVAGIETMARTWAAEHGLTRS